MAKIYGLFGAMTGKLADTVMSVRNGEQLARKYQPVVYNPSTPAQVAQRAKLKLMSQMSAVMAPYIAIPRVGSVSSRNLFTKLNFPATTYSDNTADITLANVKLTKSVVALPNISATRAGEELNLGLSTSEVDVNRVVYVAFVKTNGELRAAGSVVATEKGTPSTPWIATLNIASRDECVVYAYGVRDNTEAARVRFGEMQAVTAETVAKLIVTRTLLESDVTLTDTVAQTFAAVQGRDIDPEPETKKVKKD